MKKSKSVIGAAALGLAALSVSFGAAASDLDAPVISQERSAVIWQCYQKLDKLTEPYDVRDPEVMMARYYHGNEHNRNAIKTAVATGDYEDELERLDLLERYKMSVVMDLVDRPRYICALFADAAGDLHDDVRGETENYLIARTRELVEVDAQISALLQGLKEEGERLIAEGTAPVGPDAPVYLFR